MHRRKRADPQAHLTGSYGNEVLGLQFHLPRRLIIPPTVYVGIGSRVGCVHRWRMKEKYPEENSNLGPVPTSDPSVHSPAHSSLLSM